MAALMNYKTTGLWQRAAEQAEACSALDDWRRLETTYDRFWEKGTRLAAEISAELPGLTLHDEKHLNAVWKTADLFSVVERYVEQFA